MEQNDDVIVMGEVLKSAGRSQNQTPRQFGSTDTWHDGRPVLPGFVLDPLGVPTDKW
jgi:G patch domain-containing protein 1